MPSKFLQDGQSDDGAMSAAQYQRATEELMERRRTFEGRRMDDARVPRDGDYIEASVSQTEVKDVAEIPALLKDDPNIDVALPDGRTQSFRGGKPLEGRFAAVDERDRNYTVYFKNGFITRDDGPAIIREDGTREWYTDGRRNRENGPAVTYPNGSVEYWHADRQEFPDGMATEADGSRTWFRNGVLNRDDGPAIERPNGYKAWYEDGELHRVGAPAVQYANGAEDWCLHGEYHRTDGPARTLLISGVKCYEYYVNGEELSAKEFYQRFPDAKRPDETKPDQSSPQPAKASVQRAPAP